MGEAAVRKAVDRLLNGFFSKFIDHAARLPRLPPPPPAPEEPAKGLTHSNWSWLLVIVLVALLFLYHFFIKR